MTRVDHQMLPAAHGKRPVSLPAAPILGRHVRLDLLADADLAELGALLCTPEIYRQGYVMHHPPSGPADAVHLARTRFMTGQGQADGRGGGRTAYSIRLITDGPLGRSGSLVGTASLLEAHLANESIHLGATLYGVPWWGTVVNPEVKLLLLRHCFDDCGYGRVRIQTDSANARSLAAIRKLGARQEGVLRRDTRREDGTFRDTVVFSVLSDEWPDIRASLVERLS